MNQEITWNFVGLTPAAPGRARGLVALRHYEFGEVITPLTACFYDDDGAYQRVVQEMGSLYEHTVLISDVKDSRGQLRKVRAVLVGLGQHLRHCGSERPNCTIKFDWAKGFNNGGSQCSLNLISFQKNRVGIALNKELLIDRGLGSGLELEELESSPHGKRARLSMESMFAKHFGPASESKGDPSVCLLYTSDAADE